MHINNRREMAPSFLSELSDHYQTQGTLVNKFTQQERSILGITLLHDIAEGKKVTDTTIRTFLAIIPTI